LITHKSNKFALPLHPIICFVFIGDKYRLAGQFEIFSDECNNRPFYNVD